MDTMSEDQRVITSKDELAKIMKRSRRQIDRWIRAGMPVLDDNCFDLSAIKQWLLVRKGVVPPGIESAPLEAQEIASKEGVVDGPAPIDGDGFRNDGNTIEPVRNGEGEEAQEISLSETDSESDRYWWDKESKKYQARLRELDYRKRLGELIERVKVEDEFVARVHSVKKALIALERALPPELIACRTEREMSEVIRKAVRNVLENFARPLPKEIQGTATQNSTEV